VKRGVVGAVFRVQDVGRWTKGVAKRVLPSPVYGRGVRGEGRFREPPFAAPIALFRQPCWLWKPVTGMQGPHPRPFSRNREKGGRRGRIAMRRYRYFLHPRPSTPLPSPLSTVPSTLDSPPERMVARTTWPDILPASSNSICLDRDVRIRSGRVIGRANGCGSLTCAANTSRSCSLSLPSV
jgi:hypothetical protein